MKGYKGQRWTRKEKNKAHKTRWWLDDKNNSYGGVLEDGFSFKAFTSALCPGDSVHTSHFSTSFIWEVMTYSTSFRKSGSKTGAFSPGWSRSAVSFVNIKRNQIRRGKKNEPKRPDQGFNTIICDGNQFHRNSNNLEASGFLKWMWRSPQSKPGHLEHSVTVPEPQSSFSNHLASYIQLLLTCREALTSWRQD